LIQYGETRTHIVLSDVVSHAPLKPGFDMPAKAQQIRKTSS